MESSVERPGLPAMLLVVYVAWFATTPYHSPHFQFLVSINFERVLAAVLLVSILVGGAVPEIRSQVFGMTLAVFLVQVLSYLKSPYTDVPRVQHWASEHWKKVVFFVLLVFGVRTLGELGLLIRATFYVQLFYQILTWKDFLGGGSYVYQQGIKRICGVWSGGGLGAPNGFASMSLFFLPYAVFMFQTAKDRKQRLLSAFAFGLLLCSILYSGTRGAFLAMMVYFLVMAGRRLLRFIVPVVIFVVIGSLVLPTHLVDRYGSVIGLTKPSSKAEEQSKFDKIAEHSAESRIEGFLDGIAIGSKWPLLGCGPEGSPEARLEIRDTGGLALHNLFGQVVAELGFGGSIVWAGLLLTSLTGLIGVRRYTTFLSPEKTREILAIQKLLLHCIVIQLVYGMCAHSLYQVWWLFVFGHQVILKSQANKLQQETPVAPSI